ncbi:cell wall protein DAN4, partial [Aplysia californica]|uniref:Cell wall protein DAN4 n=1 Tax=Aplysia californica TaxID=6500 RepID=A0ABM1A140_APLCA
MSSYVDTLMTSLLVCVLALTLTCPVRSTTTTIPAAATTETATTTTATTTIAITTATPTHTTDAVVSETGGGDMVPAGNTTDIPRDLSTTTTPRDTLTTTPRYMSSTTASRDLSTSTSRDTPTSTSRDIFTTTPLDTTTSTSRDIFTTTTTSRDRNRPPAPIPAPTQTHVTSHHSAAPHANTSGSQHTAPGRFEPGPTAAGASTVTSSAAAPPPGVRGTTTTTTATSEEAMDTRATSPGVRDITTTTSVSKARGTQVGSPALPLGDPVPTDGWKDTTSSDPLEDASRLHGNATGEGDASRLHGNATGEGDASRLHGNATGEGDASRLHGNDTDWEDAPRLPGNATDVRVGESRDPDAALFNTTVSWNTEGTGSDPRSSRAVNEDLGGSDGMSSDSTTGRRTGVGLGFVVGTRGSSPARGEGGGEDETTTTAGVGGESEGGVKEGEHRGEVRVRESETRGFEVSYSTPAGLRIVGTMVMLGVLAMAGLLLCSCSIYRQWRADRVKGHVGGGKEGEGEVEEMAALTKYSKDGGRGEIG